MPNLIIALFAAPAALFFALSVKAPPKQALIAGLLSGSGYFVSILLKRELTDAAAVFFAALFICLMAETAARLIKTPATVFVIPSIIPLVPGVRLYRTILLFGAGDNYGGVTGIVQVLLITGALSMAVTVATLTAKIIFRQRREKL